MPRGALPLLLLLAALLGTAHRVSGCTVPADRRNDDFCDCDDGSDEPGTTACAGRPLAERFRCDGKRTIPLSHVRDGVCDCCDASDEAPGVCAPPCLEREARRREALYQRRNLLRDLLRDQSGGGDCVQDIAADAGKFRQAAQVLVDRLRAAEEQEDQLTYQRVYRQLAMMEPHRTAFGAMLGEPERHFGRRAGLCHLRGQCWSYAADERLFRGGCAQPESHRFNFTLCPFNHLAQARLPSPAEQQTLAEIARLTAEHEAAVAAAAAATPTEGEAAAPPEPPALPPAPEGLGPVLLGRWADTSFTLRPLNRLQRGDAPLRAHLYAGGEPCWEGPDRTAAVFLHCGDRGITRVIEDGKCTYEVDLEVPEACTEDDLMEVEAEIEELDGTGGDDDDF